MGPQPERGRGSLAVLAASSLPLATRLSARIARGMAVTQGPERDVTPLAPGRDDGERVTALESQAGPLVPACQFLTTVRCSSERDS